MKTGASFLVAILTLLAILVLAIPASVSAHQGNPNFRSEVTAITPEGRAEGIEIAVRNFDDGLELVNRSGRVVVVKGYDGEPYLRFDPSGDVWVNLNSPAHYLNQDRFADVEIPERADADAAPDWKQIDDTGVAYWHDHRSHYMGAGTPAQVEDESTETKVFDYRIPMSVDGAPVAAIGTLTWVGKDEGFPIMPFIGLALIAASGTLWILLRRRRREGGGALAADHGSRRGAEGPGSAGSPPAA
jgi:hypothetical protein